MRGLRLSLLLATALECVVWADNWPQWRGPKATGVSDEKNLPMRWSAGENVAWKTSLAGLGISTPIVFGDRVFVTSQIGAAPLRPGNHPTLVQGEDAAAAGEKPLGGVSPTRGAANSGDERSYFVVEAFTRSDGRRLWEYRMEAAAPLPAVHEKHNLASPSPVTDGERIIAWFGTGQLVALDIKGKPIWSRHLGKEYSPFEINWGHGSSPVLYQDLVILLCDHTPASYLLALDKRTGKERWKADRGKGRVSYSTPLVVETSGGPELIVNSSERIDAYNPGTGEFLWHVGTSNRFPIPTPVYHEGTLYMSRGYRSGPYVAVKPGGRGDVSPTQVVWTVPTGAPYISSLVYAAGLIYMANDVGVVTAVDAKTGTKVWQERIGGIFAASPVAADNKVYLPSETGEVIVLRAGRTPEVLARNDLGERLVASIAISNGRLFIRTDEHLFCIGRRE